MSDERAELVASGVARPVQRLSQPQREVGERSKEPPENPVGHAAHHAGAEAAHFALEQTAKLMPMSTVIRTYSHSPIIGELDPAMRAMRGK